MDAITLSAISHPLVDTPSEQAHALAPICVPKSELNDGKSISDRNLKFRIVGALLLA
jgi:hypothetical protein